MSQLPGYFIFLFLGGLVVPDVSLAALGVLEEYMVLTVQRRLFENNWKYDLQLRVEEFGALHFS